MDSNLRNLQLAKQMNIFTSFKYSRGQVIWLPRGLKILKMLKMYLDTMFAYQEISTPPMYTKAIWAKSGHLDKFSENMYFIDNEVALKPMSCPPHFELWALEQKENPLFYHHLPIAIKEYGLVYRREAYGAIQAPFRLSSFTQDDSHILCTFSQMRRVILNFIRRSQIIYTRFNMQRIKTVLSLSIGTDKKSRLAGLLAMGIAFYIPWSVSLDKCGGAFYGPKFELHLEDRKGKLWQCGTIQIDLYATEKFNIKHKEFELIVLHKACLGSMERFTGIMIESTDGEISDLPCCINTEKPGLIVMRGCEFNNLVDRCCRLTSASPQDISNASRLKSTCPYVIFIGTKEVQNNYLTIYFRGVNYQILANSLLDFISFIRIDSNPSHNIKDKSFLAS